MDGWQPLAPTKRASGMYARANAGPSSSSKGPSQFNGPSDPFPPVGPFPRSVAIRILSFLSLSEQKNCALAGRALARAVADESNWSRRLDALDWCRVDGLSIQFEKGNDTIHEEREIGRRKKGKRKEEDAVNETDKGGKQNNTIDTNSIDTSSVSFADSQDDDDFGDFAGPNTNKDGFGDFNFDKLQIAGGSLASGMASNAGSIFSYSSETTLPLSSASPSFQKLRAYAKALRPFIKSLADLSGPPTNSLIFTCDLGLTAQTALLSNLLRYISTSVGGGSSQTSKRKSISLAGYDEQFSITTRGQEAAHRLLQNLLSSFEGTLARRIDAIRASSHGADTSRAVRRAEDDMLSHASGVWELGNARLALALSDGEDFEAQLEDQFGRMQAAKVFLDKCEILTDPVIKHDPLANVTTQQGVASLDFTPMDNFISDIIEIVKKDGEIIARVFPPEQDVLLAYADRVAQDVIGKYVRALLQHTQEISSHLYLRSCAATFAQAWKLVDVLLAIEPRDDTIVTQARCEDVVFHLWEENMEDYLSIENQWVRQEMQAVTDKWDNDVKNEQATSRVDAAFIGSQNPAAVKRSVLTGFKDVLLLPVTVVPRTAGIVGGAVIRTAGTGLSTLNPLRWQSGGASSGQKSSQLKADLAKQNGTGNVSTVSLPRTPNEANEKGYMDFSNGTIGTMDSDSEDEEDAYGNGIGDDMNDIDEWNQEVAVWSAVASTRPNEKKEKRNKDKVKRLNPTPRNFTSPPASVATPSTPVTPTTPNTLTEMQLLLSLDTALQVIHVNRDCLKRIETFKKYPHPYGEKVLEAIEEVSLLLFRALGEGHIASGFEKAIKQIQDWRPEEHAAVKTNGSEKGGEQQQVEPLVHFFELVHVGDTIAQMVQVYFDQEMSRHIDKNDFLNAVVKGRKKFEGNLDEAVARGLNAGVDLLLGQAEHIITSLQQPKDYNPPAGHLPDLTPTRACRETVECLKVHCRMLVGAADKNVLEVFYQEVGIRLHTIICKHLKSQLISLDGGFRVIADLNEYHAFVVTLRQPQLTADFDSLKMLGNLYIIDNPKELAKLARDANMFGGSLSPEDLYEFLQARADFRSIEKAIDKEMYGFKVSEDCCIC
ncbi:uncharacterized protein FA14DRAFT_123487 [Meira miltonrushii]|uniref:Exocyst complex component Sec10-like alpha-helical bundle domain-containing protein n=1 Tax=Meira miltonrushii TaxID=1280837 RepID=A0A316VA11_9BASI|nr:uncharacterized protein FA14DRAFT_123487 [Meira miltonrushii]PWN34336.1 hypothetical protein FA14DRAFT_123487 [Meira miltonrushii]